MKSTITGTESIRRVSLELQSKSPTRNKLSRSRVSMCYSVNLKKRTDALHAQKTIFDDIYPKSSIGIEQSSPIQIKGSPNPKPKKQAKALAITKLSIQKKTRCQNPENPRNTYLKDKERRPQTSKKADHILPNYDTSKTIVVQQTHKQNMTILADRDQKNNQGYDCGDGKGLIQEFVNCGVVPLQAEKREKGGGNQDQADGKNMKGGEQKLWVKMDNNRIMTAPCNSNILFHSKFSKLQQKQIYKTNQINFSQHFKNLEEGSSVFPTCRKMAISSVNKFYELCIEDIRDLESKKKKAKEEKKQKQRLQKAQEHIEELAKNNTLKKIKVSNLKASNKTTINSKSNEESSKAMKLIIKNSTQEDEESHVWLEIKNTIEDEEQLGYTMCTKKQIIERSSLTASFKRHTAARTLLKKCPTDIHRYEGQDEPTNQTMKMIRAKSMRSENTKHGTQHFNEDGPLAAWETIQNNFESNINLNQNEFTF